MKSVTLHFKLCVFRPLHAEIAQDSSFLSHSYFGPFVITGALSKLTVCEKFTDNKYGSPQKMCQEGGLICKRLCSDSEFSDLSRNCSVDFDKIKNCSNWR